MEGELGVWVFKRGKRIAELEITRGMNGPFQQILIFGSWIVGCSPTRLEIWKSAIYEHYTTLRSSRTWEGNGSGMLSGVVCSMPTLLNKIFVGKQDGGVELWNVSTGYGFWKDDRLELH